MLNQMEIMRTSIAPLSKGVDMHERNNFIMCQLSGGSNRRTAFCADCISTKEGTVFHKNQKERGFTLVEVIVVSVIVAILASVAIPLYIGYVNDSAQNMANNEAKGINAAICSAINYGFNGTVNATSPITGPAKLIWANTSFPVTLSQPISYQVGNGVVVTYTGSLTNGGGTGTVTVRGKNATFNF
jgi:prepilin-type N-terminal cleavage/methylation domain-containing protein